MSSYNDNKNKSFIIEGKKTFFVKLEDNTGKKPETARKIDYTYIHSRKIQSPRWRYIHRFRGCHNLFYNNKRRQHGLWLGKRRGVKIIIRNLAREVTNYDIKSIFEKIGPINRCGIIWNSRNGNKNIAEVEYVYISDAFKAYRRLDYKSIKGIPIRLGIKDIQQKLLFEKRPSYLNNKKFWSRHYLKRMDRRIHHEHCYHYSKNISKMK